MLPQRGPFVFGAHGSALLEQRDHPLHERADVARPDALPDGEAVAADRVDGSGQLVGDALRRPDIGLRIDADLAGRDVPQRRRPPGQVEAIELAADALDRPRLDRAGQRLIEIVGREIGLQHRRQ